MFCGNCGLELRDGMERCPLCGAPTGMQPLEAQPRNVAPMEAPMGGVMPQAADGQKPPRSRVFAGLALACAVLAALTCFFPFASLPLSLAGLILGILGRRSEEKAMATTAVAISIAFLIWNVAVVIIALIYMGRYGFDLNHIKYFVEQFFRNMFH